MSEPIDVSVLPKPHALAYGIDGPQANMIVNCLQQYFNDNLQEAYRYLSRFRLHTCRNAHLDLFGAIMDVPRPKVMISEFAQHLLKFTQDLYDYREDIGLAITWHENWNYDGGLLAYNAPDPTLLYVDLDDESYRVVLETIQQSEGTAGSLVLLQDLLYVLIGENCIIERAWDTAGDIYVRMHPDFRLMLMVQGILDLLYGPTPIVRLVDDATIT